MQCKDRILKMSLRSFMGIHELLGHKLQKLQQGLWMTGTGVDQLQCAYVCVYLMHLSAGSI